MLVSCEKPPPPPPPSQLLQEEARRTDNNCVCSQGGKQLAHWHWPDGRVSGWAGGPRAPCATGAGDGDAATQRRGKSDCGRPCNMGVCSVAYGCLVETRVIVTDAPAGRAPLSHRPHLHFSSFPSACFPPESQVRLRASSLSPSQKWSWSKDGGGKSALLLMSLHPLEAIRC